MTVVVTGAAGFVGNNLVRALLAQGRDVRALILHPGERAVLEGLPLEIQQADVRDPESLARAFSGGEVVYHLASAISLQPDDWPRVKAINADGARHVVAACRRCGVRRLVHFSSFHALEQTPLDLPLDESAPLISATRSAPYNRSKALGEQAVREAVAGGLDAVILNPTGIIGPGDPGPSWFGSVLLDLARGRLPYLLAGGCDWVDVRDVVAGALQAEAQAPAGARYLLSGHYVSLGGIARLVREVTGCPPPRLVLPMALGRVYAPLNTALSRLRNIPARLTAVALEELSGNPHISHAHAARDLGFTPRPIRESIADALGWYAANGYLPALRYAPPEG
ncbi:MAG: NAD-dependent epimerase/dehydratase family protein [Anaerolineae bacterium]|nr:NAD-dependent epimerase/dehydratase family protein [Anaerolineae bacterium]